MSIDKRKKWKKDTVKLITHTRVLTIIGRWPTNPVPLIKIETQASSSSGQAVKKKINDTREHSKTRNSNFKKCKMHMYHNKWTTRDTLCESRGHPRHHPQGQWWSRQTIARRKAQSVEVVHDLVVPVPHRRLSLICIKYARANINMFLKHVWYQHQTKGYTNYIHSKNIKI